MKRLDDIDIRVLGPGDAPMLADMMTMFGAAFGDPRTYGGARPPAQYVENLLSSEYFIALAALNSGHVIGGLAAYELRKFEQARSEIYIYDLAVEERHRRRGVATALIRELQQLAARRSAYVIFVQADVGDDPAIQLYTKLGRREDVLHFDISVD